MTVSGKEESPQPIETYGGQYRSVAFGTWKVGQARRFAEKYRRSNQRAQSVQHECQYKQPSPSKEPIPVRMTRSLDAKAARKALSEDEDNKAPLASASTSGASSPVPEGITRSYSSSDLPAKEAPADSDVGGRGHMLRMGDGDCYSSSEYVQYHNAYENVVIGRPLKRRDTFNRSMDALNDRFMQGPSLYIEPQTSQHHQYTQPLRKAEHRRPIVQTTTFPASTFGTYTSSMYSAGPNGWSSTMNACNSPAMASTSYYDPMSCSTLQTPRHYQRQFIDSYAPEMSPSTSRQFIIDPSVATLSKQPRGRAKSLDNASRFATRPRTKRDCSESQAEEALKSASALQSARNFFRKIYTTSTLRFRPKNGKKSAPATPKFQHAISPFFEVRLPEPEERPFLPYKIRYELKTDSDEHEEEADDTEAADTEADLTTESGGTVATGSTTAASSFAHSSPDEGMFSSEEKSLTGSDHNSRTPLAPALSSPASSSSAYGSLGPKSASSLHRRPKTSADKFTNWNDLFSHLKKEIIEIRERDADLLNNLTTLKTQIEDLKSLN